VFGSKRCSIMLHCLHTKLVLDDMLILSARGELLAWMNDIIHPTHITKIEQCGTGAVYCQVSLARCKPAVEADHDRSSIPSMVNTQLQSAIHEAKTQVTSLYNDSNSTPGRNTSTSRTSRFCRKPSNHTRLTR